MDDLLGDALPVERKNRTPEAGALKEVLLALTAHPTVAWCERMNSPDLIGQLRDGSFIGVEVKVAKGKLRPEQAVFLERIRCAGGVAFIARDCRDVLQELVKAGKVQDEE